MVNIFLFLIAIVNAVGLNPRYNALKTVEGDGPGKLVFPVWDENFILNTFTKTAVFITFKVVLKARHLDSKTELLKTDWPLEGESLQNTRFYCEQVKTNTV